MGRVGTESEPRSIALAEDDLQMRVLLAHALRKDGHEVIEYSSGDALFDGLARACRHDQPPALVITDVWMPGRSGLSVMHALRDILCDVPIVVITAFGTEDALNESFQLGASVVLRKPFAMDDLRRVVNCLVPGAPQQFR
jgi:DNA-binding response OmpR family regulator